MMRIQIIAGIVGLVVVLCLLLWVQTLRVQVTAAEGRAEQAERESSEARAQNEALNKQLGAAQYGQRVLVERDRATEMNYGKLAKELAAVLRRPENRTWADQPLPADIANGVWNDAAGRYESSAAGAGQSR